MASSLHGEGSPAIIRPGAIAQHYDSMALVYQLFWGSHLHHGIFSPGASNPRAAQRRMLDFCSAQLGLQPGSRRVLDVGCGHGGTMFYLASRLGYSVDGITVSSRQAVIIRFKTRVTRCGNKVSVSVRDAEQASFPAEAYDLVWAMESTEHLFDKPAFFASIQRTLRPAGQLLLAAWTGSMTKPAIRTVAERFLCPSLLTAENYGDLLISTGLHLETKSDLTTSVVKTWDICQQRAHRFRILLSFFLPEARSFVDALPVIRGAFEAGDLTYTVITARK
ncbi:MAG: class I SAM-dependent methyltransferase [Terriglobales bacterium]